MVELELPKNPTRKQKQPVSIPFVWETKPGTPRIDWKPVRPPPPPPPNPPTKLIASVPFVWEEEPGKPLTSFPPKIEFTNKDETEIIFESINQQNNGLFDSVPLQLSSGLMPMAPYSPMQIIALVPLESEENPVEQLSSFPPPTMKHENIDGNSFGYKNNRRDEKEMIFQWVSFQTDEYFDSVPLQLANSPMPPEKLNESIPSVWEGNTGKPQQSHLETIRLKTDEVFCSAPSPEANRLEVAPPNPPIKLITSVPFKWEEEPGKPLTLFPLSSAPLYFRYNDSGDEYRSEDESEMDSETLSFHTDESLNSVPSLLDNRLKPAVTISNDTPFLEAPPSPLGYESDSSTSSYATGTTSLVGAPFLERLFPLLSPKLSFPEKVGCPEETENSPKDNKMKLQSNDSNGESSFSAAKRRATTLGELIMMSRRRSYITKAVQIRNHNTAGSMKNGDMGCFMFGVNNRIEGLHRKMKRQLQLKLI